MLSEGVRGLLVEVCGRQCCWRSDRGARREEMIVPTAVAPFGCYVVDREVRWGGDECAYAVARGNDEGPKGGGRSTYLNVLSVDDLVEVGKGSGRTTPRSISTATAIQRPYAYQFWSHWFIMDSQTKYVRTPPATLTAKPRPRRTAAPMRSRMGMRSLMMSGIGRRVTAKSARELMIPAMSNTSPSFIHVAAAGRGICQYASIGLARVSFDRNVVMEDKDVLALPNT